MCNLSTRSLLFCTTAIFATEMFRELHTVSQESPCCHSVVFEALGERNCLHLCFFTKFPFSIYFLRHFDLKTTLCPVTNLAISVVRSTTRNIPLPPMKAGLTSRKRENLY